jgi:hypothetical protein
MARKRTALTLRPLRLHDELGPRADRASTPAPRNDSVRPPSRGPSPLRGPRAPRRTRRREECQSGNFRGRATRSS